MQGCYTGTLYKMISKYGNLCFYNTFIKISWAIEIFLKFYEIQLDFLNWFDVI